jgi:hypothetical protein
MSVAKTATRTVGRTARRTINTLLLFLDIVWHILT